MHVPDSVHTMHAHDTGQPSREGRERAEHNKQSNTSLLDEDIMRQEGVWALGRLKGTAAPGNDGLMMNNVRLVDFWYELFKLCWKEQMVPSIWKQSVVIPVPKMSSKGPCVTDDFHGISAVSVPYKTMCMIMKERLTLVIEERKSYIRAYQLLLIHHRTCCPVLQFIHASTCNVKETFF